MTLHLPSPEQLVGLELGGRYRLLQVLGSGGIGHVYLAQPLDAEGLPTVAVKVLRTELAHQHEALARFEREALAASRIRHENVIEVHGPSGVHEGLRYFAMRLLVGVDLADLLASAARLAPGRAVRIALGAAAGLAASHAAGVIHRDVKPENLFLEHRPDGQERPRVLDFGSAFLVGDATLPPLERITTRASVVGTPGYLSPEQAEGVLPHPAADVYALAVTLYEMLTGAPPYRGSSWLELLHLHASEPIPELRFVSSDLGSVLVQAMAKRPEERFRSMEAFARALAGVPEARSR